MRWSIAVIVACLTGCYAPQPNAGAPCPDNVCSEGLVCSPATQTCEQHALLRDAGGSGQLDGPGSDALGDAAVGDSGSSGAAVLVQQKTRDALSGPSLSLTLNAAPTSGNMLVMMGGDPQAPLTSVSGGGVASWIPRHGLARPPERRALVRRDRWLEARR